MRTRSLLLSSAALVAVTGCSRPDDAAATAESAAGIAAATAADADARQAIDAAMARYTDAVKRGDTAAIAASFTDDAVVVFPTGPALTGKADVMKGFADMLGTTSIRELKATDNDRMASGDLVVETGRFEVTMQPKDGEAMTDKGNYIVVWRRQPDGTWKMARGFNRSDPPAKS